MSLNIADLLTNFCISSKILEYLDIRDLATCRSVDGFWRNVIEDDTRWVRSKLEYARTMKKVLRSGEGVLMKTSVTSISPEFGKLLDYIFKTERLARLKKIAAAFTPYILCNEVLDCFKINHLQNGMDALPFAFIVKHDPDMLKQIEFIFSYPISLNQMIQTVCQHGSLELVQQILPLRRSYDEANSYIFFTAANQDPRVFHYAVHMLGYEQIDSPRGKDVKTPFLNACTYGSIETVKYLLHNQQLSIDKDIIGKDGLDIYRGACANPDASVLKLLMKEFRHDNFRNGPGGLTLLHVSIMYGTRETIKFLLENIDAFGLNGNAQYATGLTPIMYACIRNVDVISLFFDPKLDGKINYKLKDNNGLNLYHFASQNRLGDPSTLAFLLKHYKLFDFNLESVSIDGTTPLHIASFHGHIDIVKLIMDETPNPRRLLRIKSTAYNDMTPIQLARSMGHLEIFDYLNSFKNWLETACIIS